MYFVTNNTVHFQYNGDKWFHVAHITSWPTFSSDPQITCMLSQAIKWPVSSYNHTCNYTGKWYYLHQLYIHQMFLWCFAASTVHSEITRCSLWRLCFHCLHRLNMLWAAVTMQLILVLLLVKPLILPVFDWSALVISLYFLLLRPDSNQDSEEASEEEDDN